MKINFLTNFRSFTITLYSSLFSGWAKGSGAELGHTGERLWTVTNTALTNTITLLTHAVRPWKLYAHMNTSQSFFLFYFCFTVLYNVSIYTIIHILTISLWRRIPINPQHRKHAYCEKPQVETMSVCEHVHMLWDKRTVFVDIAPLFNIMLISSRIIRKTSKTS